MYFDKEEMMQPFHFNRKKEKIIENRKIQAIAS